MPDWAVQMLVDRADKLGEVDPAKPTFTNTKGGYLNYSNVSNRTWIPFRKRCVGSVGWLCTLGFVGVHVAVGSIEQATQ